MAKAVIKPFINVWEEVMFDVEIIVNDKTVLKTMGNDLQYLKGFCKRLYGIEQFEY